jgi:tetratricopeptide (TPR) repeat protein
LTQIGASSDDSTADRVLILAGWVMSASVLGELDLAAERLQQAQALAEGLDPRHPAHIDLLVAAANLSRRGGDFGTSLQRLQQAEAMAEHLLGLQTEVLAQIYNDLGVSYKGLGRYREAIAMMQRARLAYAGFEEAAADIDANLGAIHESLEQYDQAIAYARAALAVQERDPQGNQHTIRQVRSNLAQALSYAGNHDEALGLMQEAVAASAANAGEGGFQHVLDRFRLAAGLRRAGRTEAAADEFAVVAPALADLLGDSEHPFNFYPMRLRASIERDRGQTESAKAGLAAAIKFADEHPGADPVAIAIARVELAELLQVDQRLAAREVLAPALEVLVGALDEDALSRRQASELARRLGMR